MPKRLQPGEGSTIRPPPYNAARTGGWLDFEECAVLESERHIEIEDRGAMGKTDHNRRACGEGPRVRRGLSQIPRVGRQPMSRNYRLVEANLVLVALLVLHDLDHVRQGRTVGGSVIAVGVVGALGALASLILALVPHPLAPFASFLVGTGTAIGFAAAHVLPHWSVISDPYPGLGVDAASWLSLGASMVVAVAVGLVGFRAIRTRRNVARG